MKAITLTQPWATLVALGAKSFETRSWSTPYRGPIAIHAAKGLGPVGGAAGLVSFWWREPFHTVLAEAGYSADLDHDLPRGAIVAVAELYTVLDSTEAADSLRFGIESDNDFIEQADRAQAALELAFGDYSPGRFAWVFEFVKTIADPIACRGALGLWDVPDEVVEQFSVAQT